VDRRRFPGEDGNRFRPLSSSGKRARFRREQQVAESAPFEFVVADGRIEVGIPLGTQQHALTCWLWLTFSEFDPLVVVVRVCAPSKAVVLERTVMRSDLRAALDRTISYVGIGMGPGVMRGVLMLYLREDAVTMTVLVPGDTVERFLSASERLVPSRLAESEATGRAFDALLEAGGSHA
jgi:hypothetical protein